ncbi:winged helix-turn-helix transcriptional regulator [Flammeovirga agarivorans]|uniref:Helix-turn-helix transcriptional regulator n=1 Tax=Flammeovirga agarivorans TaxID=2726742 RepID=A0A7X8XYB8_9BACT|nr:helix-turn-helix domain-containing protein [Flammeovirga agarivorans]NLR94067.1 helix-turn-helix transcriptional regulator [Flammeovirga agarivorans]
MRSECPISFALDFFGDKWTLLIIRDMIFDQKRFYKDFQNSGEKIATNILSDRLKKLEQNGVIRSEVYALKKTQKEYFLTEKGKSLLPVLLDMMVWSFDYNNELNVTAEFIQKVKNSREEVIQYFEEKLSE